MTRTEERLGDALRASAAQVRDGRLRPLPELRSGPGPRTARRGWRPGAWRSWLTPVAAAVSVALVIGLALTLTSVPGRLVGRAPASRGGTAAGATDLPRYFAQFATTNPDGGRVEIRSVATGAVIASAPSPRRAGWSLLGAAMAAAPDARTFYVAYTAEPPGISPLPQTWIYRLSITDSGQTMIKGGMIAHEIVVGHGGAMAVSPDGTKLAITVAVSLHGSSSPGALGQIVVVDLRTGARMTWEGGLDRSGHTPLIADVSWTPDGRSIVFLALWCDPRVGLNLCEYAFGPTTSRMEQVRSVPVASRGGLLSHGTSLLIPGGTVPAIAAAVAGPRPGELTLVLLSGRTTKVGGWPAITVQRLAAPPGSVLGTEYRRVTMPVSGLSPIIEFAADPSGQHQLLSYSARDGWHIGWISQGKFHPLPIRQPYSGLPITAW
jgi:hypothetical protein